ncbi:hypothetical protein PVL29_018898 [Vitis rotundifolia]|uniref:Uncharacterized protein n=1 Tax=Vitis rotundifolia TaxID=103349 RepID=A0AA39DFL2_VITRO|nr:hypothetical protein PVL29_018898 [Vitis rotundifolia]
MHSSTFSINWYTEETTLYGSTTVGRWNTKKVGSIHPPLIPWEIILMGCIIPRPCESDPNGTEPVNGGRQCMGSMGMKDGGEYSTGVKLNVVGMEMGLVGMKVWRMVR